MGSDCPSSYCLLTCCFEIHLSIKSITKINNRKKLAWKSVINQILITERNTFLINLEYLKLLRIKVRPHDANSKIKDVYLFLDHHNSSAVYHITRIKGIIKAVVEDLSACAY